MIKLSLVLEDGITIPLFTQNENHMAFLLGALFGTTIDNVKIIAEMCEMPCDTIIETENPFFESAYLVRLQE